MTNFRPIDRTTPYLLPTRFAERIAFYVRYDPIGVQPCALLLAY